MRSFLLPTLGHFPRVLAGLLRHGWELASLPSSGVALRNAQIIRLVSFGRSTRVRILTFKVGESGRSLPHERRVEITRTYASGLKKAAGVQDIVIGCDRLRGVFVGLDPRRLKIGGKTHNASSFVDVQGLSIARKGQIVTLPHTTSASVFPNSVELQAFFCEDGLGEYLTNSILIHSGVYTSIGALGLGSPSKAISKDIILDDGCFLGDEICLKFSGQERSKVFPADKDVVAFEEGTLSKSGKTVSPEQLKLIQQTCEEVGHLGEQHVVKLERSRLLRAGRTVAASKVRRVSLSSVGEGFDILSFENDGTTRRYIEVKSTLGKTSKFFLSRGEWDAAARFADKYLIARVTAARSKTPKISFYRDPLALEAKGVLKRTANGWTAVIT